MTDAATYPRRSALTGLELLGIAGATALVVALGFSAYRTFTVRAEVADGIAAARGLAPFVARAFARTREVPPNDALAAAAESAAAPPVPVTLTLDNGRIDVAFAASADPAIAGRRVSLTPYESASLEVVWICGNATPGVGLKPLGFASGGPQAAHLAATIEQRYLPPDCR